MKIFNNENFSIYSILHFSFADEIAKASELGYR